MAEISIDSTRGVEYLLVYIEPISLVRDDVEQELLLIRSMGQVSFTTKVQLKQ